MIPNELAEAFINKKHRVLGFNLEPFCYLHLIALESINSPLLSNEVIRFGDLYKACQILSLPLPTNKADFAAYSNNISIGFKRTLLTTFKYLLTYYVYNKKFNNELKRFFAYWRDFVTSPKVINEIKGESTEANYLLGNPGFYIAETGCAVEYAYTLPIGILNHLNVYFSAINSGKIKFVEEVDSKIEQHKRNIEALIAMQAKEKNA